MQGTTGSGHGWRGSGRFRVARLDGRLVVRYGGLTTQAGRLKTAMGDFFRKDYRGLRPVYDPFAVDIWIEAAPERRRLDLDNVAKACLDALTGVVWKDDSQVVRLSVVRVDATHEAITVLVAPTKRRTAAPPLQSLLEEIDGQ